MNFDDVVRAIDEKKSNLMQVRLTCITICNSTCRNLPACRPTNSLCS